MKLTIGQELAKVRMIENPYTIITGERQSGKSMLVLDVVQELCYNNNFDSIYVIGHNKHIVTNLAKTFANMSGLEMSSRYCTVDTLSFVHNKAVHFVSSSAISNIIKYFQNNRVAVIVDEAAYITGKQANDVLEAIANLEQVKMFSMISTPGPGEFFTKIIDICTNPPEWTKSVFVHNDMLYTCQDREYFSKVQYCSDPELIHLLDKQQELNIEINQLNKTRMPHNEN